MTHRPATNYAKNYCNRTLTVEVIVENVVTCFFGGHSVIEMSPFIIFGIGTVKFCVCMKACYSTSCLLHIVRCENLPSV